MITLSVHIQRIAGLRGMQNVGNRYHEQQNIPRLRKYDLLN